MGGKKQVYVKVFICHRALLVGKQIGLKKMERKMGGEWGGWRVEMGVWELGCQVEEWLEGMGGDFMGVNS